MSPRRCDHRRVASFAAAAPLLAACGGDDDTEVAVVAGEFGDGEFDGTMTLTLVVEG